MHKLKTLVLLSAVVLLIISCSKSQEQRVSNPQEPLKSIQLDKIETEDRGEERDYRAGEIIIKFRDHVTEEEVEEIRKALDLETIKIVSPPNLYLLRIRSGLPVHDVIESLKQHEEVEYSEPNYIRKAF